MQKMNSNAPQSKAALASAVASSHVETLVKTLFGPCTGSERTTDGFTPLTDSHRKKKKGYNRRHATTSSSSSRATPFTAVYEEKPRDRIRPMLEQTYRPTEEHPRRAQFDAIEEAKTSYRDDAFLTFRNFDVEDDDISVITTLTLDQMEKRTEREGVISGFTSNTFKKMAQRHVIGSKFNPSGIAMSSCSNPQWQEFPDWKEECKGNSPISIKKGMKNSVRNKTHDHIPSETPHEEKMREQAAESYETVMARLNYLKRSLEERKSKNTHRSRSGVSIVTREDINQNNINDLEFGEI